MRWDFGSSGGTAKNLPSRHQDRKETERCLNHARQMAAALVTVTERLAELIDELEGKLRTEKEAASIAGLKGSR